MDETVSCDQDVRKVEDGGTGQDERLRPATSDTKGKRKHDGDDAEIGSDRLFHLLVEMRAEPSHKNECGNHQYEQGRRSPYGVVTSKCEGGAVGDVGQKRKSTSPKLYPCIDTEPVLNRQ